MKIVNRTIAPRASSGLRKALLSTASLAILCAIATSDVAQAEILIFSGNTTGDPVWNRPETTTTLSALGTAVPYESVTFSVQSAGAVDLEIITGSYDTHMSLYTTPFDPTPTNELTNILAVDDDSGTGLLSRIQTSVAAGSHTVAISGWINSSFGTWTLQAILPGCGPAGSGAAQTINCDVNNDAGPYSAGGGADIVNINAGNFANNISGGAGGDTININSGATAVNVLGGADSDTIYLNTGANVTGTITGGTGSDRIRLNGGTVATVSGGGGPNDIIYLNGATVTGDITASNSSDDAIFLLAGSVVNVGAGSGRDLITLDGATVSGNISAGTGVDRIDLISGTLSGNVRGETGTDTINVLSTFDLSQVPTIDGGSHLDNLNLIGQTIEAADMPALVSIERTNLTQSTNLMVTMGAASITTRVLTTDASSSIDMRDGAADDMLTLSENYSGTGTLFVDAELNAGGVADTLVVTDDVYTGDATSGTTKIAVTDVGDGTGAPDPITVVSVGGTTGAGDFALAGPVTSGVFNYDLLLNGGDWQLAGTIMSEASLYPVLSNIITGDVRQLVGSFWDRETSTRGGGVMPVADIDNAYNAPTGTIGIGTWARIEGYTSKGKGKISGTGIPTRARYDEDLGFVQGGVNIMFANNDMGRAIASLFGHYGNSDSDVRDIDGRRAGNFDVDSYGVGGSMSWIGATGFYGDLLVLYSKHDIKALTAENAPAKTDGDTWAISGEAGWQFGMTEAFSIIPQVQFVYQDSDIDSFSSLTNGGVVPILTSFKNSESLEGRFGARFVFEERLTSIDKAMRLHLRTDIVHEFKNGGLTTVNGIGLGYNQKGTAFEFGAGASFVPVTGNGIKFGGQVDVHTPFENNKGRTSYSFSGLVGVNW